MGRYNLKICCVKAGDKKIIIKNFSFVIEKVNTVTSRLFTHIVSTEKVRKDIRERKDTRGTKYTYYNDCFLILLLIKSKMGTFPLLTTCLLNLLIYMKTKDKTIHTVKKS